jgi:acyl-[acyl-carrier-protein]-phospholipid O-acyltransferase/long-chain-fatty-acid--[acyl-carrier-protein] ligase
MPVSTQPFSKAKYRTSVFAALLNARREHGGKTVAIIDGDERKFTYDDLLKAVFAMGSAIASRTAPGDRVGLMMPTGVGAVIGFYAISAFGRVPAMLNFTSGSRNLDAACRAGQVRTIVTARRFIEVGKLEDLVAALQADGRKVLYLEDLKARLTLKDKLTAVLGPIMPDLFRANPRALDTGVILFTSGTEGTPKGVVLTHANVLANVAQVLDMIPLDPAADVLFNPLPTFHCFGLTVGAVLPLQRGIKVVFHPTPLQPREIAKRIASTGSTLLVATDTFISQYARASDGQDLRTLRLAICGAERVRDETRALLRTKCGIEILEGYGVTEAAPVIAANRPSSNRPGSVGPLLAGMEARLLPVEGIHDGGRLQVRGPNVMVGYLRAENPGAIERPQDGWHDTGDIASIDEEGCIRIRGRIKRFAKIGGEMVSLAVVENCASAVWPDDNHAAASLPDKRKGEMIVLLTTRENARRTDLLGWAQNHGVPELAVPRMIFHVEKIPVLGTGKLDYGATQRMAIELLAHHEAAGMAV